MTLPPTPGQTVGPFFHYALPYEGDGVLVPPGSPGAVQLHGVVFDGARQPVPDALVEIWQADPAGHVLQEHGSLRRDGFTFTGFGRSATDQTGHYRFSTLLPGSVDGGVPFFSVMVFARGLTHRLRTRAYLPLDGRPRDALLDSLGDRAATLMCLPDRGGLRFDIHLQGDCETVFLTAGEE